MVIPMSDNEAVSYTHLPGLQPFWAKRKTRRSTAISVSYTHLVTYQEEQYEGDIDFYGHIEQAYAAGI